MQLAVASPRAILFGILLALPFAIANLVAITGIAPLYSWLVGLGPYVIFSILTLGLCGGVVTLTPLFRKDIDGVRRFFVLNVVIGIGMVTFFGVIGYALGEEIYRCDILNIPNCD